MWPDRIVIAPDSFKGSLAAAEVAAAIAAGLARALPQARLEQVPLADGGEGTVEALVAATGGERIEVEVSDPLGRPVRAGFGMLGDGRTAVVEMAAASGLTLLAANERDPLRASTRGTGELIAAAVAQGARRLIVGIGGSATCDGGAGMAQALGVRLLDRDGRDLPAGGGALAALERIDASGLDPRLRQCEVLVACDVDNPLLGPRGAARVYGPQKGADSAQVEQLENGLARLARIVERDLGVAVAAVPGAGAAGGLGAGLMAFLQARLTSGIELVMDAVDLAARLRGAAFVVTGEGRLDAQTAHGKVVAGVASCARDYGVPVFAVAGEVAADAALLDRLGIAAALPIAPGPMSLENLVADTQTLLAAAAERLGRILGVASVADDATSPAPEAIPWTSDRPR